MADRQNNYAANQISVTSSGSSPWKAYQGTAHQLLDGADFYRTTGCQDFAEAYDSKKSDKDAARGHWRSHDRAGRH